MSVITPPDPAQEPYRIDARVELKQPPEPAKGIDWLGWVQAGGPILIALVGLYFTDTVRTGFERQQLQLANASGMQPLLQTLLSSDVTLVNAKAAASTLAAFGPPAVGPLITALSDADDVRTPAIEGALRAIGLSHPKEVCGPLMSILERPSGRYSWLMHRSAVRVIGDVRCTGSRALLQRYTKALQDRTLKTFDAAMEDWVPLEPDNARLLKTDVDRALADAQ